VWVVINSEHIKDAAWILGICIIVSQCDGNRQTIDLNIDQDKITPAYCAGLKTGEAIKGVFE
jgi:hypothetical protein